MCEIPSKIIKQNIPKFPKTKIKISYEFIYFIFPNGRGTRSLVI